MPSQIKVDEIKNVAGQYKIKTNVFEGQTTAGSITVQGEGTATTNLQQGLNKALLVKSAGGGTIQDSFNVTSMDDDGTGQIGVNLTNNMNTIYYVITTGLYPQGNTTVIGTCEINEFSTITTSAFDAETCYANSSNNRTDYDYPAGINVSGDLA